MRYENLFKMIEGWNEIKNKIEKQPAANGVEKIINSELTEFCQLRAQQVQQRCNVCIESYNNGNVAAEEGVDYQPFSKYLEALKKDNKYWRNAWDKRINVHDHNRLLQDKLKTLSAEAAEIISRLESELKEAQTAAADYKKQYLTCFHKFLKLEEENAILRGDISEDGLERY